MRMTGLESWRGMWWSTGTLDIYGIIYWYMMTKNAMNFLGSMPPNPGMEWTATLQRRCCWKKKDRKQLSVGNLEEIDQIIKEKEHILVRRHWTGEIDSVNTPNNIKNEHRRRCIKMTIVASALLTSFLVVAWNENIDFHVGWSADPMSASSRFNFYTGILSNSAAFISLHQGSWTCRIPHKAVRVDFSQVITSVLTEKGGNLNVPFIIEFFNSNVASNNSRLAAYSCLWIFQIRFFFTPVSFKASEWAEAVSGGRSPTSGEGSREPA